jgi:hypothetical protein
MDGWWREIRFALRGLGKRPGFIAAAVGALALGIGASTAIFSVIHGVMLRPLPDPEPDRSVILSESWKDQAVPGGSRMSASRRRLPIGDLERSLHLVPWPESVQFSGTPGPSR